MELDIKSRRKDKRMSQEELASLSGISRQTVIALESGTIKNVTAGTLQKMVNFLVMRIIQKKLTLDRVPAMYREAVEAELTKLGWTNE